jgi:pimeloyl-ACP methyl ester carboxylesterase
MGRISLLIVLCLLLFACADLGSTKIDDVAQTAGLTRAQVSTDIFLLTTFSKIQNPAQPIDVYIEGDGLAWITETMPSSNPTPRKALGLRLAAQDSAPNILYVARPCQYTPLEEDKNCTEAYWTDRRFSEEVIRSVNQAIDRSIRPYPHPRLNIIGYSGGGAVAILVAARRDDVATLRTVAGNLDHDEVNRLNGVSPLHGSLNAIAQARKVENIPQLHFSGSDDDVVPPIIAAHFIAAMDSARCARAEIVENATHEDGWEEKWRDLLRAPASCAP